MAQTPRSAGSPRSARRTGAWIAAVALAAGLSAVGSAQTTTVRVEAPEPVPIPVIEGDPARGQQFFQTVCFACHGNDGAGRAELGSPSLHQQDPWYLVAQLRKFRAGLRGAHADDLHGSQMKPMSLTLPDEQALSDVALYVTSVGGPRPPITLEGNAESGAKIYADICVVCHGPDARGKGEFQSPSLLGQADWYVEKQIRKFRDGLRGSDPVDTAGQQMKVIADTMKDDQSITDVAVYIATLE